MELTQVKNLKLNVTNINSFLKKSNKDYIKLKKKNSTLISNQMKRRKQSQKEKIIESKNLKGGGLSQVGNTIQSSSGGIFSKILEFGSIVLTGILVQNLPKIIETVRSVIDSIVEFVTPIQSAFNLIKGFMEGSFNKNEYDMDKKRVDDKLEELNKKDGLIDQISEQAGILKPLIKALKPAIEVVRNLIGGKNKVLAVKDGKEGVLDQGTNEFTERQFTTSERQRYTGAGGQGAGGQGAGTVSKLGSGNATLNSLTDQQFSDLAYAVSGEAQPNSDDEYGVAANILTRFADPGHPNTIMGVFTAGSASSPQYAAYWDGGARRDPQLAAKLKANKNKIAEAIQRLNGRTDFKGTSQYGNMGPGDIKFSDRGNFYHYETEEVKDSNGRLILPAGKVVDKDFSFHYTNIDTSINNTFGQLQSINVNNGGSGFVDGTYTDIQATTGGIGIGATFTVTVSEGKIEKENIIVTTAGKNYDLGNSISFIGIGTTAGTDTETEISVNRRFTNTRGVTNWEYEGIKNNKKSSIYLLKQGYLQQFLNDMREIMTYGLSSEYVNESLIKTENTKVTTSY